MQTTLLTKEARESGMPRSVPPGGFLEPSQVRKTAWGRGGGVRQLLFVRPVPDPDQTATCLGTESGKTECRRNSHAWSEETLGKVSRDLIPSAVRSRRPEVSYSVNSLVS